MVGYVHAVNEQLAQQPCGKAEASLDMLCSDLEGRTRVYRENLMRLVGAIMFVPPAADKLCETTRSHPCTLEQALVAVREDLEAQNKTLSALIERTREQVGELKILSG